jgi:predicted RecB family nuclease
MQTAQLPYLDEHVTSIAAGVDDVWRSLLEAVDESFTRPGAATYARLVGCDDCKASGPRPLAQGSTISGFRVVAANPGRELVLEGRHRFSAYALIFRLEQVDSGRSWLRAETRAAFPGVPGGVYRLLVFRTGFHVRVVRSLLSGIRRGAERRARSRI